jgi:DNA polymerase
MRNKILDVAEKGLADCQDCGLCHERSQIVFGTGSHNPIFMIVGEAPGENEDKGGEPFVGQAGEKLNKILDFVGVTREEIYITNTVLCRPPNNRDPQIEEMDACRWRLHLQIEQLQPKFIVLLGKMAATTIVGSEIKGALFKLFETDLGLNINGQKYPTIVTYHPSYLLRTGRRGYRQVLPHWQKVKELVNEYREDQRSRQDPQACDGENVKVGP